MGGMDGSLCEIQGTETDPTDETDVELHMEIMEIMADGAGGGFEP